LAFAFSETPDQDLTSRGSAMQVEDIQKKAVDKSLNGNLSSLGSGSIVCPSKTSAEVENSNIGVDDGVIDENSSLRGGDVDIQTNRRNELEDMVSFLFTGLCFAICFVLKLLIRILPHEVLHLHSLKTQPWSI
jgi:hypothetical protein